MRISRNELFYQVVEIVSHRSTCNRRKVGAVIGREGRILSMGYAGSPAGTPHCQDVGCLIGKDGGCIRTQHAEANAIAWAARQGISTEGATLFCSLSPCLSCAKLIINSGIKRVEYQLSYRDSAGIDLLREAGIAVDKFYAI